MLAEDWADDDSAEEELIAGIAAWLEGRRDVARRCFDLAAAELQKGDYDDQALATFLREEQQPESADVIPVTHYVSTKRLILVAVGLLHPEVRGEAFNLARRLSFDPRFPHLLIQEALASGG